MNAECILPAGAILAEGPVWNAGRLLWVDIERGEIHELDPGSGADQCWKIPHRVGFAIPSVRGDLVVGADGGLARLDRRDGTLAWMAHPEPDCPGNRFNDAKCDDDGRLWAGTMAINESPGRGTLYRIGPGGQIHPMVRPVTISNGLAWSPDGRTMYYVDSPTRRVDAFDFDPATGAIAGRRTVIQIPDGFPDGLCADVDGNLWIAVWGGGCVACHDPRTGARVAEIRLPAEAVTSCCFDDSDRLWITTASRDLDATGRRAQPQAGGIFRATVGVRGLATNCFAG